MFAIYQYKPVLFTFILLLMIELESACDGSSIVNAALQSALFIML